MSDETIYRKAVEDEMAQMQAILDPCVEGKARMQPVLQLKAEDLDRAKVDREETLPHVTEDIDPESQGFGTIAADCSARQERQRIRRDVVICRANRKRFLYGCMETLWKHQDYLKGLISDNG